MTRNPRLLAASALLALAAPFAVQAADISASVKRADTAAKAGDHAASIAALQEALDAVRLEAPMTLDPFLLVSRPAKSFGDVAPRPNAKYAQNEELLFYAEPKNLVYGRQGGGYEPAFEVDLFVLDSDGDEVAAKEKFGSFRFPSQSRLQDLYLNLNVSLTGAPAGAYTVRFVVRDLNSTKKATAEKTITVE